MMELEKPKPKHRFWKIVGLTLLGLFATVVLAVVVAYSAGTVDVSVREKKADGTRIHLFLPAMLITEGVRFVPADEISRAAADLRPWLPAIRAATKELARCPDATLVDVQNREEKVTIIKRGNSIVVDVDDAENTVHISLPLKVVAAMVDELEPAGEAI